MSSILRLVIALIALSPSFSGTPGEQKGDASGGINTAPLKAVLTEVARKYMSGQVKVPASFSVAARFNISSDGSLSRIALTRSSGSKEIDQDALAILRAIGESHILAIISNLSSTSARLDVTASEIDFALTGIAPTTAEAQRTSATLKSFVGLVRAAPPGRGAEIADLLRLVEITSNGRNVRLAIAGPRSSFESAIRPLLANRSR